MTSGISDRLQMSTFLLHRWLFTSFCKINQRSIFQRNRLILKVREHVLQSSPNEELSLCIPLTCVIDLAQFILAFVDVFHQTCFLSPRMWHKAGKFVKTPTENFWVSKQNLQNLKQMELSGAFGKAFKLWKVSCLKFNEMYLVEDEKSSSNLWIGLKFWFTY